VHESEDTIEQLTTHLGIVNMFPGILEADDVIAYLCRTLQGYKTVVSTDNDMAQLVSDDTQLYSPVKKILVTLENFEQHYPVSKNRFLLYKSIIGDAADNIKGVAGYGKVKAKKLTENFEQEHHKLTEEQKTVLKYNLEMVDLKHGLKVHPEEETVYAKQLEEKKSQKNFDMFKQLCEQLKLYSILSDPGSWEALLKQGQLV
jgi:DNA polymerase-1